MTLDMTLTMALLALIGWALYAGAMHMLDAIARPPRPRIRRVR
jgi:hypothetical protein